MARMIPLHFDQSTVSAAERRIFDLFKNDPGSAEWTVLHALGLAKRGRRPYGEIDFVVLIPNYAVVCLEIKGGRISCSNGEWTTTNRYGQTDTMKRSPFLQARDGMFALRSAIGDRTQIAYPNDLLFAYGVVFPDVEFQIESPEWESWQVIDQRTLLHNISKALLRIATEQRKLHSPGGATNEPSMSTVRIVTQILRPDFEIVVTRATQVEDTEQRLLRLTEDQYMALDFLDANERCLVEGAAGTGKTMLALEYGRRSALSGRRTLFICYNQLLGDWLARRVAEFGLGDKLIAGRHFQMLRSAIAAVPSVEAEFHSAEKGCSQDDLFSEVLPLFGIEAIETSNAQFDQLIVDEAQDLLCGTVLPVWQAWLRGGMPQGRWAIFGDFYRQAIFHGVQTGEQMKHQLVAEVPNLVKAPLKQNCRNTRRIGEETALLSGFESPPYRIGQVEGAAVDYQFYRTQEEQRATFVKVIQSLLKDNVKPFDIVVLSKLRLENSCVSKLDGANFKLHDAATALPLRSRIPIIRYSTAHAFKGMESPVVVLCDVEHVCEDEPQALLYIAMSRARSMLFVLLNERVKPAFRECLMRKMREEATRDD